jgi:hypothetical protein
MALRQFADLQHDDEDLYDLGKGMPGSYEPPEYPTGLMFSLCAADLESAGAEGAKPGDCMRFSAMGEVTSVFQSREDARVELEVAQFAGEDGKFFDLVEPLHICLCEGELTKMGLDCDCERGDTIHLIGEARVENCSDTEYGGERCGFQTTRLTFEDESDESREGG